MEPNVDLAHHVTMEHVLLMAHAFALLGLLFPTAQLVLLATTMSASLIVDKLQV
jgi:hypothetical protein